MFQCKLNIQIDNQIKHHQTLTSPVTMSNSYFMYGSILEKKVEIFGKTAVFPGGCGRIGVSRVKREILNNKT